MKRRKMVWLGTPAMPTVAGLGARRGPAVFAGRAGRFASPKPPEGEHGAASMEYQMAELQKLQPEAGSDEAAGRASIRWFGQRSSPKTTSRRPNGSTWGGSCTSTPGSRWTGPFPAPPATMSRVDSPTSGPSPRESREKLGKRNAPTTLNVTVLQLFFWDGRAPTLERQAGMPILNPVEMGMPNKEMALKALRRIPEYQPGFPEGLRPADQL